MQGIFSGTGSLRPLAGAHKTALVRCLDPLLAGTPSSYANSGPVSPARSLTQASYLAERLEASVRQLLAGAMLTSDVTKSSCYRVSVAGLLKADQTVQRDF